MKSRSTDRRPRSAFSPSPWRPSLLLLKNRTHTAIVLRLAALLGLVGPLSSGGCSSHGAVGDEKSERPNSPGDTSGGSPTTQLTDSGATLPSLYRGNPLCRVRETCMPDDDRRTQTTGAFECASASSEPDAGEGTARNACRIVQKDGQRIATCEVNGAGKAGGSDACEVSADCGAGLDCILEESGAKRCRHYCCNGTCKAQTSGSGGATFCDIQTLAGSGTTAPVCMPLKPCELLREGDCGANETCAVVTETGTTGCVGLGDRQAGSACDDVRCSNRLTCLGQPGNRKCFALCKADGTACGPMQVCRTSTVFSDPKFGICLDL